MCDIYMCSYSRQANQLIIVVVVGDSSCSRVAACELGSLPSIEHRIVSSSSSTVVWRFVFVTIRRWQRIDDDNTGAAV